MTITEAQERLTRLPREFEHNPDQTVIVTTRGAGTMMILPLERYEGLVETLEILSDPATMAMVRESIEDIAAGRVYDFEDVVAELDIAL